MLENKKNKIQKEKRKCINKNQIKNINKENSIKDEKIEKNEIN
jgi:hypothetical protein